MDFIEALEKALCRTSKKDLLPLQPGDVSDTYANVKDLVDQFGYTPSTTIEEGITNFISLYHEYHGQRAKSKEQRVVIIINKINVND